MLLEVLPLMLLMASLALPVTPTLAFDGAPVLPELPGSPSSAQPESATARVMIVGIFVTANPLRFSTLD